MRAFVISLENPEPAKEILKKGYELQNLGKGLLFGRTITDLQFMILRNQT